MKIQTKHILNRAVAFLATFCTVAQPTYALNLATEPLFLANRVTPKVMLALSKDQQLYKKAYNDYSDLDGDGVAETTYKHSVTYYGYFDPIKCYKYANDRFEPVSITTSTVVVDGQTKPATAYCNDSAGRWSGNFLNWVSMARIDAIRKLLYGGLRAATSGGTPSVEETGITVLERSYLPTDAHAWAKYYNGNDIAKLTPFTVQTGFTALDINTKDDLTIEVKTQDLALEFTSNVTGILNGDQVSMQVRGDGNKFMFGSVIAVSGKTMTLRLNAAGINGAGTKTDKWTLINRSIPGISFCNLTQTVSTATSQSDDAKKAPPLIRVAKGNFALWNANERWQCIWGDEIIHGGNGNQGALSGLDASARSPRQDTSTLGTGTAVKGRSGSNMSANGTFIARVQACVSVALAGTENCKSYGGNLKPVGLLQTYSGTIDFGLMTGSYEKNTSGGVLRKAVGSFNDEILADGRINTATEGIVKTLNNMRMYGYNYADGTYLGAAGDNCNFQLTDIPPNACTSWGNPMAEIYYESLRYFASGATNAATPAYVYDNSSGSTARDKVLGLPMVNSWTPPLNAANSCAKINVLAFNASVSSEDSDLATTVVADINTNKTARELTNTVGDLEGITNKSFFIGKRQGDASDSVGFELCTAKTVTAFGDAVGICPEGPTVRGSYLLAGLAHHGHTTQIRTNLTVRNDPTALKVTSYGIQLATNTPQLEIPVPGKPGQKVLIQPIYRYVSGTGAFGGGALVDMKIVSLTSTPTSANGKVYLNWEDSEQGGDYDQDMWGTLEWSINSTGITVFTNAISSSTSGGQGFGYAISGTTEDGPHFHSGINGFNFTDSKTALFVDPNDSSKTLSVKGCVNCQAVDVGSGQRGKSWMSYSLSTSSTAGTLKDPLWYLAKYGGFDDRNGNGKVDDGEWDVQNNLTGAGTPDGVPDTYFLVTNPLGLEAALERAFRAIGQTGSGAALASNAGSIRVGSAVFAASFKTAEWSGDLQAFQLQTDGSLRAVADWTASSPTKLPAPDKRVILTYRNDAALRKGVPFRWPADPANPTVNEVGKDLVDALNTKPDLAGTNDGRGAQRLAYLRGDASQEGNSLNSFRTRPKKLGDIIHSAPVFVPSIPNDVVLDKTYVEFQKPFLTAPRTPMVYVAANDGMLHGFDANILASGATDTSGGTERIAYMPSKTFPNLSKLTSPTYVHRYFNDGSPTVADAKVNDTWKTVLVGALGQGGRGVYALDVTNPPPVPGGSSSTGEESAAAPKVLWEFNVEDDVPGGGASSFGLGYVLGQPLIRKMANGKYAAIFSGGYNSDEAVPGVGAGDGKAYTFIVFLDGPKGNSGRTWQHGLDYVRLEGVVSPAAPNGFAPPFATDTNSDGMVDFLYMGDLLGNFWKFDVSDKNANQWNNASNRVILFKAGATQPITAAAQGIRHPNGTGFILSFGTGKYLEPTDPTDTGTTQSFYGIWDKNDKPNNVAAQTVVTSKNQLFQQVIKTTTGAPRFRYIEQPTGVSAKGPDWGTNLGWYMDLPDVGERSVFEPVVASRRLIFSTLVPSGSPCDYGGTSFIMVVNPATGGEFDVGVIDVNRDGKLTNEDRIATTHFAAGFESTVGIAVTPKMLLGGVPIGQSGGTDTTLLFGDSTGRVSGAGNRRAALLVCGAANQCDKMVLGAGRDSGRATWREVVKK